MYIRAMDRGRLLAEVTPFLVRAGVAGAATIAEHRAFFTNVVACEQERVTKYVDLPPRVAWVFADRLEPDSKAQANLAAPGAQELLAAFRDRVRDLALPPSFPAGRGRADESVLLPSDQHAGATGEFVAPRALEDLARKLAEERGAKFGALVHPLRAALTGRTAGPSLFDLVYLLGREKVLARLDAALG
jgi:glutamyl/glutaminyl-tRNA synthetase